MPPFRFFCMSSNRLLDRIKHLFNPGRVIIIKFKVFSLVQFFFLKSKGLFKLVFVLIKQE